MLMQGSKSVNKKFVVQEALVGTQNSSQRAAAARIDLLYTQLNALHGASN
jgi:hypothetical protein